MSNYHITYKKVNGEDKKYPSEYNTSQHPLRFKGRHNDNLLVEGTCTKEDLDFTVGVLSVGYELNKLDLTDRKTRKLYKELQKS